MRGGRFIRVGTVRGEPLVVGGRRLTPLARTVSVALQLPRVPGAIGFVWTRPVAVEVEDGTGSRRVPIPDVTRVVVWGLLGAAMALPLLAKARGLGVQRQKKGGG